MRKVANSSSVRIQRGISIVTAIFLVVVLAALGVAMMNFSTVQSISSADDVQGSRAYQAARAGVEWGAYQVLVNTSCAGSSALPAMGGALSGFSVTVTCSSTGPYTEAGGTPFSVYQLTSTATRGTVGTVSYVERQLQTTITK
jgi:MSHA biogenesis protein MshP